MRHCRGVSLQRAILDVRVVMVIEDLFDHLRDVLAIRALCSFHEVKIPDWETIAVELEIAPDRLEGERLERRAQGGRVLLASARLERDVEDGARSYPCAAYIEGGWP